MNLDIRELTSSLSSYSFDTNQAVTMMANAVRPIGYILLGLFFWFEMASWSQMVKSRGGALTQKIWLEALMKYLFAFILISASSQICDAILELLNIVVKVMSVVISIHLYFNFWRLIIESHTLRHVLFLWIFLY